MKKTFAFLVALVVSVGLTAPAHAFLVDGFGDPTGALEKASLNNATGTATGDTQLISDTDFLAADRTLEVSNPTVGGSVDLEVNAIDPGFLAYASDLAPNSTGTVDWLVNAPEGGVTADLLGPIRILVEIINSDVPDGLANAPEITFELSNGVATQSATAELPEVIQGTMGSPQSFILDLMPAGDLTNVNSARLFIETNDAFDLDLRIDFIESVPAPGVIGLIGLGLLGLGIVTSRRRGNK